MGVGKRSCFVFGLVVVKDAAFINGVVAKRAVCCSSTSGIAECLSVVAFVGFAVTLVTNWQMIMSQQCFMVVKIRVSQCVIWMPNGFKCFCVEFNGLSGIGDLSAAGVAVSILVSGSVMLAVRGGALVSNASRVLED